MRAYWIGLILGFFTLLNVGCTQAQPSESETYIFRKGDPNGIGKWYMGREIAHVMGHQGIDWLERPERAKEEKTDKLIKNMALKFGETVADIGAGSGYHSFMMAGLVAPGVVYAVDIQDEMLSVIRSRMDSESVENIAPTKGSVTSVNLEKESIDKILLVDVYHEFSHPQEMLASIYSALKPNGKVFLIEFRKEDAWVPIKEIHKMTLNQAVLEFDASGFVLIENKGNLPWQHCMVFEKRP